MAVMTLSSEKPIWKLAQIRIINTLLELHIKTSFEGLAAAG